MHSCAVRSSSMLAASLWSLPYSSRAHHASWAALPCERLDGPRSRPLSSAKQVVRGEWTGHGGRVLALADEEREAVVDIAGRAERTLQAVQRADCGRVVLLAKRTGGPPGSSGS